MWILQISDIHLAEEERFPLSPREILRLAWVEIRQLVKSIDSLLVMICGDLTSKGIGSGYPLARHFFEMMLEIFEVPLKFFVCPGNHDIQSGNRDFPDYSRFAWELTGNQECIFNRNRTSGLLSMDGLDVLVVNSAHHGDHAYGLIDLVGLNGILSMHIRQPLAVITHHHLVPMRDDGRSVMANSYAFLQVILSKGARFVLHGHTHQEHGMMIGKRRSALIGVGSLFRPPGENFNCQFNMVNFSRNKLTGYRYRLIGDLAAPSGTGSFLRVPISFY